MFNFRKNREQKEHLKELSRERCRRYYRRHKEELKESKKYGSLSAYRRAKENQFKKSLEKSQVPEKQEFPSQV